MEIGEKLEEFLKSREYCGECGSKNFEVDYTGGGKYFLNSEKIICKDCKSKHTFDERMSLDDWRIKIIESFLGR